MFEVIRPFSLCLSPKLIILNCELRQKTHKNINIIDLINQVTLLRSTLR